LLVGRGYTAALFAIPLVILLDAAGAALVIRAQDRARSQA
jgi:acetyl-CoA carboxylase alpha subunit